jgi:hypothetical protein
MNKIVDFQTAKLLKEKGFDNVYYGSAFYTENYSYNNT